MINYKKIIKSRAVRLKILHFLSFIPDKQMVQLQYRIKTGRKLDLEAPQRYTEKLQWYKLYYKDPRMIQCVDKYDVREYVKSKGLGDILIPCYGVYDSAEDINWDALPEQFVVKNTLGGGGNAVILVKDKSRQNLEELKAKCREWTAINVHRRGGGREWPYSSGKNCRIIIEKYIESSEGNGGLIDYKFFCFAGRAAYLYVVTDRVLGGEASIGIFDKDFQRVQVQRVGERPLTRIVEKPENYEALKKAAETLSKDFPHVRVDLYNVNGNIFFGEMTFYNASGYMLFSPDEFDFELGRQFPLPDRMRGKSL